MKSSMVGCILLGLALAVMVRGEEPAAIDAEALCKLLPRISLKEEAIETFQVSGVLDLDQFRMRFRLVGKKPDKMAMWIMDPVDGTPVMVGVGKTSMLYDPLSMKVMVGEAISVFVMCVQDDPDEKKEDGQASKAVKIGFGFSNAVEPKEGDDEAKEERTSIIDMPSFVETLERPLQVKEQNGVHVIRGLTKKKNMVTVFLSPTRKEGACTRFELQPAGAPGPALILDSIVLNQPVLDSVFEFPMERLKASNLHVVDMKADGVVKAVLSIRSMMLAFMTRVVMAGGDDPQFKQMVEKMSVKEVDWDKIKANDEKSAPALKEIFKTDE